MQPSNLSDSVQNPATAVSDASPAGQGGAAATQPAASPAYLTMRYMRGFVAVGLNRPKIPSNVGGVLRLAQNYDVSLVAIAGDRSLARQAAAHSTNTTKAERHLPVMRGDDLRDMIPFGAVPIAVDLVEGATPLPNYQHPPQAFYIFGPEDGTLGTSVLSWCRDRIMVPTHCCMNLHVTVGIVLYDRMSKAYRSARKTAVAA